jgi:hypothetical protein
MYTKCDETSHPSSIIQLYWAGVYFFLKICTFSLQLHPYLVPIRSSTSSFASEPQEPKHFPSYPNIIPSGTASEILRRKISALQNGGKSCYRKGDEDVEKREDWCII